MSLPGSGHLRIHQAPQQDPQGFCAEICSQGEGQTPAGQPQQAMPILYLPPPLLCPLTVAHRGESHMSEAVIPSE